MRVATAMKFVLEKVTSKGVRLGRLVVEKKEAVAPVASLELETPVCLLHTRSGFLPCLTPDIVQDIPYLPPASLLSVATMCDWTTASLDICTSVGFSI